MSWSQRTDLNNSKFKVERWEKTKKKPQKIFTTHGPSCVVLVPFHPMLFGVGDARVVLYTVHVLGIHSVVVLAVPTTWGDIYMSSCFLSHSLPEWEYWSGCINQDMLIRPHLCQAWNQHLPLANSLSSCCGGLFRGKFLLWPFETGNCAF